MSIPVEFINPFFTAVQSIFNTTLKIPTATGKPRLVAPSERIWKLFGVSASITLNGAARGAVMLSFSESVAITVASGLSGEHYDEFSEDARDALGEVANLVIGVAKRDLPGGLVSMSPPRVTKTVKIEFPVGLPVILLPFESGVGRFVLQVAILPAFASSSKAVAA